MPINLTLVQVFPQSKQKMFLNLFKIMTVNHEGDHLDLYWKTVKNIGKYLLEHEFGQIP